MTERSSFTAPIHTDLPISSADVCQYAKVSSVFTQVKSFLPAHFPGEISAPYRFAGLSTMTEGLLALFAAGDFAGITDSEWEDIFYNNAAEIFYPIIRTE